MSSVLAAYTYLNIELPGKELVGYLAAASMGVNSEGKILA